MKKICGFVDKKGGFHKTEVECRKADIQYRIAEVTSLLNQFENNMSYQIFKAKSKCVNPSEITFLDHLEKDILKSVCKMILNNSEKWQNVIKSREELKEELNYLKTTAKMKVWWLKYKWW